MKLPSFLQKKESPQYFLTLLLREEKVSSIVFEQISGKVRIISQSEEYFEGSIEDAGEEEFLEVIDKVVSKAETKIPLSEKQKTVFGLKENWVEELKIKKEYLLKLKKTCEALGLLPIGFLITHEAIANLLEKEEGAPPTAILIEVNKNTLTVTLIKGGKVLKTSMAKIEDSIPKTTDRILHHFTAFEVLPSRIILFEDTENENLIQQFINHSFSKSLPFLHVPQVSILSKDFAGKAVVFGVASQMKMDIPKEELGKSREQFLEKKVEEEEKEEEEKEEKEVRDEPKENQEIKEDTEEKKVEEVKKEGLAFGFKENTDVAELKDIVEEEEKVYEKTVEEVSGSAPKKKFKFDLNFLPNINLLGIIENLKIPNLGNKIILIPPIIIALSLILLILYIFAIRATISIKLSPKNIDDKYEVTFVTNSKTDTNKGIIQAESISVSLTGSVSKETEGKKEIGDKAKGSVTLYSRFTNEKNIPAQTILTSSNGLKFELDLAVKISSASSGASSQATITKASVTAKEIGKEYNLPSGTKFTIGAFEVSDIEGKNETAFLGGSKKEVRVVSKEDYAKLEEELPKKLKGKARIELKNKIGNDKEVLSDFSTINLKGKQFSKKIGDDSEDVSLEGTVEFIGIVYKKSDLLEFSKLKLSNNPNLVFIENSLKTEVLNLKNNNQKEFNATLRFSGSLIPKIEEKKLKEDLAGKSFFDSKRIIDKLPQVYETTMSLSPDLPLLPRILPRLAENITLIIKSNE